MSKRRSSKITEDSKDTNEVVQTVVKTGEKYLIAKRSRDSFWEFMGGKIKKEESIKQAAIREINEETDLGLREKDFLDFEKGESYLSEDNEKYRLNPVLIEIEEDKKDEMTAEGLSDEHTDFQWINLEDFYSFETLGQFKALQNLEIVNGDVAISIPVRENKVLVLKRSESSSSSGFWNFPGGKIEDEKREKAALRELQEETDLSGKIIDTGRPYIGTGELGYWRIYPFLVDVEGKLKLNQEHSEFRWIRPEEIENLDTLGTGKALEILDI